MTMLIDQATQLRSLAQGAGTAPPAAAPAAPSPAARAHAAAPPRRAARRASVLAVTSGKGGVGKSNVAVNLAIEFASSGKRVVLLDADLGLANADVLANVDLPYNLSHVIARRKSLSEVMVEAPGGFRLIGGASGLARMADLSDADRQRLVDALAELEERADVILIDTGAGISPNVLSFTRAADHVLVVTTPEPTAITDAYAVIKVLSRSGFGAPGGVDDPNTTRANTARATAGLPRGGRRVSLLVNFVRAPGEARVVYDRIAKVARQFLQVTIHDAGYVSADEQVPQSVRRREPFVLAAPECRASRCIVRLAARLQNEAGAPGAPAAATEETAEDTTDVGFFERMLGWLRR